MGNIFKPRGIQSPNSPNFQSGKVGAPRPIIFGTVRPVVGNLIATTPPLIVRGADKTRIASFPFSTTIRTPRKEIFRTYAIRICEGPVTSVDRIWRNNELFYVRDPESYVTTFYKDADLPDQLEYVEAITGNNSLFDAKFEIFLGGFDQMPSAAMQSAFGIENVHAYRGTCYIVAEGDQLTATGGAIPQYAFEVSRCPGTPMMFDVEGEHLANQQE
ncbi:hypothetical protein [Microbulbifer sp.]|uniref:hypothetical protein n=1 Tax=Microbulbifer sp. TaxID=1908541 RepID=UPI003F2C214F